MSQCGQTLVRNDYQDFRFIIYLLNENLCKQRDLHIEIEFDLDEKHIHLTRSSLSTIQSSNV